MSLPILCKRPDGHSGPCVLPTPEALFSADSVREQLGRARDSFVRALAVLEEWMSDEQTLGRRTYKTHRWTLHPELSWCVRLKQERAGTSKAPSVQSVSGRTMPDALAQAAQVVVRNPNLED